MGVRALGVRFPDFMIAADEASIMIVDDSMVTIGISHGEEGNAEPSVDEGRGAHAQGARARQDEDDGDRAEAQTERSCCVSACIKAGRGAGRRSKEERGVKGTWRW